MDYDQLIGPKSTPGSLHDFINYKRVPVTVVLDEAQALISSVLRVREMRASALIALAEGQWTAALPTGYLEPISMYDREGWEMIPHRYVSQTDLQMRRSFDDVVVTTLDGAITAGAVALTVVDPDEFPSETPFSIKIDSEIMLVTAGEDTVTWTVTRGFGGTTAAAHSSGATVDGMLETGTPMLISVFDELFQFDVKAEEPRYLDLVYFRSPTLLSPSNKTNFITSRYPTLLRVGCLAAAARYMKDKAEFDDRQAELAVLVQLANAESDFGKAA